MRSKNISSGLHGTSKHNKIHHNLVGVVIGEHHKIIIYLKLTKSSIAKMNTICAVRTDWQRLVEISSAAEGHRQGEKLQALVGTCALLVEEWESRIPCLDGQPLNCHFVRVAGVLD